MEKIPRASSKHINNLMCILYIVALYAWKNGHLFILFSFSIHLQII